MSPAYASACLVAAALVAGWPAGSRRARRRRLGLPGPGQRPRSPGMVSRTVASARAAATQAVFGRLDRPGVWLGQPGVWLGRPGVWLGGAAFAATAGLLLAGPVAAVLAGGYAAAAVRWLGRRQSSRAAQYARARVLDSLGSLAADLRAGMPPDPSTPSTAHGSAAADPLSARVCAAVSLAESTGAPLADLIERIEADARAGDRAAAAAEAQCAGARATALLLAGLPAAGIALGQAIGADPLRVLLHTPVGAACAVAALALQLAGLAWSARLARPAVT